MILSHEPLKYQGRSAKEPTGSAQWPWAPHETICRYVSMFEAVLDWMDASHRGERGKTCSPRYPLKLVAFLPAPEWLMHAG